MSTTDIARHVLLGCMTTLLAYAPAALAADEAGLLEEVVITAEHRETDLQKTAISVTAITGENVEKTGITSYENLLQSIPGIQVQAAQGPISAPYVAVRGVGTDGDNKPGATAIYLDGVTSSIWGGQLYDLSRVEILRGPQGTLYGGTATGGALNIVTNNPDLNGLAGNAQLEAGNYQSRHYTGMVNVPFGERVGMRVAVNNQKRGEYSNDEYDALNQTNARVKFLFEASDALSFLLGAEYFHSTGLGQDGQQDQNAAGDLIGTYNPVVGVTKADGRKYYADINWDMGPVTLTSISAVQTFKSDGTTLDSMGAGNTVTPNRDTTTQELRLASNNDSGATWVTGLWYKNYKVRANVNIGARPVLPANQNVPVCLPPIGGPPNPPPCGVGQTQLSTGNLILTVREGRDDTERGVFGQVTVPVSDRSRITGGLRYSKDGVDTFQYLTWTTSAYAPPLCAPAAPPCTVPTLYKRKFTNTDWLLRFEHDLDDDSLLYALASTGYRPGAAGAPRGTVNDPQVTYDKESVRAYEIGSKNRFNDRVQINGAIFYNDYPVFQNVLTYWQGNARLGGVVGIGATLYGAELELQSALTERDTVSGSASYLSAKYKENGASRDPFTGSLGTLPTNGKTLPHAPEFQLNLGYDHAFFRLDNGSSLVWGINGHYQTKQALAFDGCVYSAPLCLQGAASTQPNWSEGSYTLLDSSLSFKSADERFTVTAYVRNLGDVTYKTNNATTQASLGAPRVFGVVLGAKL